MCVCVSVDVYFAAGFLARQRNIGVKISIFPDSTSEIAATSSMALISLVPLGTIRTFSRPQSRQ